MVKKKARIKVEYECVCVHVCVLMLQLGGLLPLLTLFETVVHVSDKGCGPGGTSGAHTTWYSPTCRVLTLRQVDLPVLALSA